METRTDEENIAAREGQEGHAEFAEGDKHTNQDLWLQENENS